MPDEPIVTPREGEAPEYDVRVTFDDTLAGRLVEADGGAEIEGGMAGYRTTFKGTLTGRRMSQGDPPWKWLELEKLTEAPTDFASGTVWVDEAYVYLLDGKESG